MFPRSFDGRRSLAQRPQAILGSGRACMWLAIGGLGFSSGFGLYETSVKEIRLTGMVLNCFWSSVSNKFDFSMRNRVSPFRSLDELRIHAKTGSFVAQGLERQRR